ncbi:hypothetical protein DFQ27_000627, partial [Actinomortierella ambigua]
MLCRQVGDALVYLHMQSIVHRDIKSEIWHATHISRSTWTAVPYSTWLQKYMAAKRMESLAISGLTASFYCGWSLPTTLSEIRQNTTHSGKLSWTELPGARRYVGADDPWFKAWYWMLKSLLEGMLKQDQDERLSIDEVLEHSWFQVADQELPTMVEKAWGRLDVENDAAGTGVRLSRNKITI